MNNNLRKALFVVSLCVLFASLASPAFVHAGSEISKQKPERVSAGGQSKSDDSPPRTKEPFLRQGEMESLVAAPTPDLTAEPVNTASAPQVQALVTGLSSPLLVTNAHDGSNRIFIVEQPGTIKVLQPGSTTPTVFLNIGSKVVFGGEQGLLGLTFHPQYWMNGRFFVNYSRMSDGEGVVAEYHVSATDPNVADPNSERILLTVPQPFTNHNGGMVEFGPDGFLYISRGDGGSAFDPGNRAQNPAVLNGKILRIDVDHTNGAIPYAIPPTNPFATSMTAAHEVYAFGLRNPFRFSFDHATGQLYAGDVGQNLWEEVDIVTNRGNYGWRIFEGNVCTMIDPCNMAGLTFPILVYDHSAGKCAIIGGYVYRGTLNTISQGLYTYGDLCSGQVFAVDPTMTPPLMPTVLASLGQQISSFGEDESGELYVCEIGAGTVVKIQPTMTCSLTLGSQSQSFMTAGGAGSFMVNDTGGCAWSSHSNASWITVTSGGSGAATGMLNFSVAPNSSATPRLGTISVAGTSFKITQAGTSSFSGFLDGAGCGTISGWAWDANNPNSTVSVDIFDGNTLVATAPAGMYREDLLNALGSPSHGFSFPTPTALKNGASHSITVKISGTSMVLGGGPKTINCAEASANLQGFHDGVGCDTIVGWARDANDPGNIVNVDVYDGTTLIGTIAATQYRQDLADAFGNPYHGFNFPVPANLKDGQPHSITVKFGGTSTDLSNTPKMFTCMGGTPNLQGSQDAANCTSVTGFAWDSNDNGSTINVAVYIDGNFVVTIPAQQASPGIGSGFHGYSFTVPAGWKDSNPHSILVRFSGTSTAVSNSPRILTCP
ncbi:MAG TPA: PQQ-dependent sugar dehydrogenase [Blastocatellia bacterium]|nr:PQQ-dependent sugar dehydrogenase [Blastocatellia bacterium]